MVRRSDGRWQQSVTDIDAFGRRKTKYFYGKTKSELLQKIAAYNAEAAGRKRGVTFQTLADGWWEEAEPALAPNTTKGDRSSRRRVRFTPLCAWLISEVIRVISVGVPKRSNSFQLRVLM